MTSTDGEAIDLTKRTEPLSLSDISRALGLQSRGTAQKWHKAPKQAAMEGKEPANKPALPAVAEAMGITLGPELLEGRKVLYPPEVVLALGKALGYLDSSGRIVEEVRTKGRGRWLPVEPTIDPATKKRRIYTNHLAARLGINNETIEMALSRGRFKRPDGTDEIGRVFWWQTTANAVLREHNLADRQWKR